MATTKGQVTLRGRFRAGSLVKLVKVAGEHVLRAEGGVEPVAEATVDAAGCVQFTEGVEVGARYLVVGQVDGFPVEVRARGNEPDDENSVLTQAPVQPERQRLSGGQFADEVVPQGAPRSVPERPADELAARKKASAARKRPTAKKAAPKAAPGKSTTAKSASRSTKKGK
jgi:hypothetical protein